MSASRQKKTRNTLRSEGNDKKQKALTQEEKRARDFRRNEIIAIVCIVLVVAAALVINSNLFYTKLTAVTINETKYSAAEVDVFYRNSFNTLYSSYQDTYGEYASYFVDPSTPLSEQTYSDTQTWADYIYELTLENMRQITALYDEATKNGYTLSEDDQTTLDTQVQTLELQASLSGASNVNHYLAAYYGKGVNEKVFESVMRKIIIAQGWSRQINDGFTYTDAEVEDYYGDHADAFDYIRFETYYVSSTDADFEALEDDNAKLSAAHDVAVEIANASSETAFAANVDRYSAGAEPSEQYVQGSELTSYYAEYSDWLLDATRQEGDTTVVDTESGSYALFFLERDDNDYNTTSMRHILIEAEADENYEYTDEAKEAAHTAIEEIYDAWQEDPTEDNFATLANERSEDPGSNTNGGLYEGIRRRQMVTSINDFLFDPARKPGDTDILYGETGSYSGWHLVYFVGEGDNLRHNLAETEMRSTDMDAYMDSLTEHYTPVEGSAVRYVNMS